MLCTWKGWNSVPSDLYSIVLLWYLLSRNILMCCKSFFAIIYHTQRIVGFFILCIWRVFPRYILCLMDWMICVFELFMRSTCTRMIIKSFKVQESSIIFSNINRIVTTKVPYSWQRTMYIIRIRRILMYNNISWEIWWRTRKCCWKRYTPWKTSQTH